MIHKIILYIWFFLCLITHVEGQENHDYWAEQFEIYSHTKAQYQNYSDFTISNFHQSKTSNTYHIYYEQIINRLEVVDGNAGLHFDSDLQLIMDHDQFYKGTLPEAIDFTVVRSADEFLLKAWNACGFANDLHFSLKSKSNNTNQHSVFLVKDIYLLNAEASLKYLKVNELNLILTWEYKFESKNGNDN